MYQSSFSFPITRKYPYRWFTPTVIIGGIIATALLSLLNFVASGYSLIGIYTQDPNATLTSESWVQKWPDFLAGSTKPTCQPFVIPINERFQTNNTALTYTLTGVYRLSEQQGDSTIVMYNLGSVPYYNNFLEDCNVTNIRVRLQSIGASAKQNAIQFWNADISADATCKMSIEQGHVYLNVTADYNLLPSSGIPTVFNGRNATGNPATWWAESLLSAYWIQTTDEIYRVNTAKAETTHANHFQGPVYKGTMSFTTRLEDEEYQDISSLDYYQPPDCFFETFNANGTFADGPYCGDSLTVGELASTGLDWMGPAWIPADSLAKSVQSTILTDLGQTRALQANIIGSSTSLEYFSTNITSIINDTSPLNKITGDNLQQDPNLAQTQYDRSSDTTQPPAIQPSVISATYFCQIPQLKSTGSLLVSLILADLVFLQALWQAFLLIVDAYTAKRYPSLMCCEKCGGSVSQANTKGEYEKVVQQVVTPLGTHPEPQQRTRRAILFRSDFSDTA